MHKKIIFTWELIGVISIILLGVLVHYLYDLSNKSTIVGLFSPVNESVWEHLKLGFSSFILFSFIEYWWVKDKVNNFFLAKALGIITLQATIIIVFYTYTAFTQKEILFIDISSYIVGSVFCQLVSYNILISKKFKLRYNRIGAFIIIFHAVLLLIFTYYPPKLHIFQDQHTKSYGILELKE